MPAEGKRQKQKASTSCSAVILASAEFIVIPGNASLDSEFLKCRLNSSDFVNFASHLNEGDRPRIDWNQISRFEVLLPPLPEQERIVAKIEELFSDLDHGVAMLKKAQAQLKVYRQAVLKYAFEGKLTAEWRKANAEKLEPAEKLLEKIKLERETHYNKQLADWEKAVKKWQNAGSNGKKPTKPRKPKNLPALTQENLDELPALPGEWAWVRNHVLLRYVTSGSRGWAKYYSSAGAAFLRMGNLDHDTIDLDLRDIQRVALPDKAEGKRSLLQAGDILVSATADVGMIAVVPETMGEAYINQHVALARPIVSVSSRFLAWYLASQEGGQRQLRALQRGATKVGLGLDDIKNVCIPLAGETEQLNIVAEIESRLSVCDKIEEMIEANFKKAESLRQSILKKAFEGKLVPQNPNDEPAEALLARIQESGS